MKKSLLTYILPAVMILLAVTACSSKKNTALSRQYTAFITRYNVYFNGDEHFHRTLEEMEKNYEDDYTRTTLFIHPAEAYADPEAPQPSGDFTRSIEKAQKAIQLRSITKRPRRPGGKSTPETRQWLKRGEYNPFIHNAWLLLGYSQYMNGDFLGAAATFHYITKHFTWLPETVTEATLWRARCYLAAGWLFEAESILNNVKEKELIDDGLRNLYDFDMANLAIRRRDYKEAIPYLSVVASGSKGASKARLIFLLGQLYELTGQKAEAYNAFGKVAGMSGASHRTRFNARIKQSEVHQGDSPQQEIKNLKAMTRYGANHSYLDQIYYAIGNLYLSCGDTTQAIANYRQALSSSTSHGVEAASAALSLGRILFDRGEYIEAQPLYAFASTRLHETYPGYDSIRIRSDVLDELAQYSHNIALQDSLLTLAAMTPDEQRSVVDRIIARLEKQEKEEAEIAAREEYLARQQAAGTNLDLSGATAPSAFTLNTDKSWYFYNEAARSAGQTDFRRRWGNRKLEDDWRRRNKTTFSTFSDLSDTMEAEAPTDGSPFDISSTSTDRTSDPHYPEYYLRQIPATDAEKSNASSIIQESMFNSGMTLKDRLEDYPAATRSFETLLNRFPDNIYRLDAYHNMYLIGVITQDAATSERYRQLIISDFPESKQAIALADPMHLEKMRRMPEIEDSLYRRAYNAYFADDNAGVHRAYTEAVRDYPMSRNMPKFMFLEALSYVTENNPAKFAETMRLITERYPDSDVAPLASSYLGLLAHGERLQGSRSNIRGMERPSANTFTADSSMISDETSPHFGFRADTAQVVMLVHDINQVPMRQILFDVARHNFMSYSVSDFDLAQIQTGNFGLLMVSGFRNARDANAYKVRLENSTVVRLPSGVMPLIISKPDLDMILNGILTIEEYIEEYNDPQTPNQHPL